MALLATILVFIGLTSFLIWFFLSRDRGPKEPRSALIEAFGFGVLALILAFIAEDLLNTGLFLYFSRASELDREHGLSAQGPNRYCPHCGAANPDHALYCKQCGRLT